MIEVEAPDGSVVEFPDGTTSDVMRSAMQKRWGGQQQSAPQEAVPAPAAAEAAPEEPNTLLDVGKSIGSGLANAAVGLAGLPGDIGAAWNRAGDKLTDLAFGDDPKVKEALARGRSAGAFDLPKSSDIKAGVESVTGEFHRPETTAGEYAQTIAEFVPGVVAGPGGLARRALSQVVAPAVGSETAGQLTEGTAAEPYARVAGAVGGALVPGALSRAVTPLPIDPARQQMIDTLRAEGVPLTAGQSTGNRGLQYAESILADAPFAPRRAKEFVDRQGDAFSTAAMRRVGENAPATPEVVGRARDRISQAFEDISSRNSVAADQQLANDIGATVMEYARVLPANQKEVFGNMAGDIVDVFVAGPMPGNQYQEIRSRLSRMANSARTSDPEFSNALRGLRNALDEGFRRQVRPEDAAGLDTARRQWGNLKTIEKAATGGGEGAAFGRMSPAQLRQSVASGNNRGAYARGEGDFAELARAGQAVMTPLPNSGTAQRNLITAAIGGGAGLGATGNLPAAAAAIAGPTVASHIVHSRPVQAYLSNQVMTRLQGLPASQRVAIASALAARGVLSPEQAQQIGAPVQ